MKKSIGTVAALMLSALFVCTGCGILGGGSGGGGGEPEDESTFGSSTGKKTVVTYYSFNNEKTNKELKAAIEQSFYKEYPGITVNLSISTGSFFNNVFNDFVGGTAADIIGMEPGEIAPFLMYDYLEPLDDYFASSEKVSLDDLWAVNKQAYSFDPETNTFGTGKTYAVMKDWSTDAMIFYNRSLFSKEQLAIIERDENGDGVFDPITYAEFQTLATSLIKKDGSKITQYGYLPGLHEAKVLAQFLTNAGLSWFDPSSGEPRFNQADVKEVLNMYYSVLAANDKDNAQGDPYPLFAQGNVAMTMGGLYCMNSYGLANLGDNLGIAYPPVKEKGMQSKPYTTGCVGFAINKNSRVKNAAFKFIEWYLDYFGEKDAEKLNNFPAIEEYATSVMLNPEVNTNATSLRAAQIFHGSLAKAVVIDRNIWCPQASYENIENLYAGELMQTIRGEVNVRPFDNFCSTLNNEVTKQVTQRKQAYGRR